MKMQVMWYKLIVQVCNNLISGTTGKDDEDKKKASEKTEDIEKMSKMDQNQNGIQNGGGGQTNKIMIE